MAQGLGRRQPVYFTLLGVAVGLLLAGVVIPLGVDDQPAEELAGSEDVADEQSQRPGSGSSTASARARRTETPAGDDEPATSPGDAGTSTPAADAAGTGTPGGSEGDQPADARPATGGAEPAGQAAQSPAEDGESPGATDRGVTADSIKLGIMLFDLGGVSELGVAVSGADPEQQREWWEAWVADLNERGGIHGRQVNANFYRYDLLDEDSQRAACREATQDDEVFAALDTGVIGQGTVLCFTRENRTPFVSLGSGGYTTRDYRRSEGLLFSMTSEGKRMMANFAADLDRLGELQEENALGETEDKTIGVLTTQNPGTHDTVQRGLVDTLEQLGYEIAHWAELSGDTSTASSQVPVAVNQMRRKGVNAVLLLGGIYSDTQFAQEAEAQQYFPEYYVSDWQGNWSQTYASAMPESFDGRLITATRTGEKEADYPTTSRAEECYRTYAEQKDDEIDRSADSDEYWASLLTCQVFQSFELGARAAGPDLTRVGSSEGMQSLGELDMAYFGGGSFAPGKFGAADLLRTAEFDADCGCWLATSEFREPRF